MDLHKELIQLLEKAKETDEYFNPFLLDGVVEAIRNTYPGEDVDKLISNELHDWIVGMYSR